MMYDWTYMKVYIDTNVQHINQFTSEHVPTSDKVTRQRVSAMLISFSTPCALAVMSPLPG